MADIIKETFALIGVATTGKGLRNNRVIEICILRVEHGIIVDRFSSLVNPEQRIPSYITERTGLDDNIVSDAPIFSEIAQAIDSITEQAILVAHNASYVSHVLQSEFRYLGYNYERPKICTIRLAKKLMPNMFSYELDRLCGNLGIPILKVSRVEDQTEALEVLFLRLLSLDEDENFQNIVAVLKPLERQSKVPEHIANEEFSKLPEKSGIYQFKDLEGSIIYVGKAKNIRRRVLSHFYTKDAKENALCAETYSFEYEVTGNELIALLLEAELIRSLVPKFNVVQKKLRNAYQIVSRNNKNNILEFGIEKKPYSFELNDIYYKKIEAARILTQLCEEFQLCPKFMGIQKAKEKCVNMPLSPCRGICLGGEKILEYNFRAEKAWATLKSSSDTYVVIENGRNRDEKSFVLVIEGIYQGFGYYDNSQQFSSLEEIRETTIPRKHTYHTGQILNKFKKKYPNRVKRLDI